MNMLLPLSSSLSLAFRSLSLTSKRQFSTTRSAWRTKTLPDNIPPYPYGPNRLYKQSNHGLYGGAVIQFGNKISKGKNKGRTRRNWKPNVRWKKLHSDALGEDLFIKVTRRALRTMRKVGGLDNYLLNDQPARIKELGVYGWQLRWRIFRAPKIQKRFLRQRQRLGLPAPPTFEEWVKEKEAKIKEGIEKDIGIRDRTKPTILPPSRPQVSEEASQ
jgi:large subunit ribosomal protein L28